MRPAPGAKELWACPAKDVDVLRAPKLAARSPGDLGVSTRLASRAVGPESGSGCGDSRPGLFKIFGDSVGMGGSVAGVGLSVPGGKPPVLALRSFDELVGLSGCEGFRMLCISRPLEGPRVPGIVGGGGGGCSRTGGGNIGADPACVDSASPVGP
jgi:hypothetical protein